jgi:amidohydrolase
MIKDGALENPHVDTVIALHVWPSLKVGQIGMLTGSVTAASDHLKIKITGKSAHASAPDLGIDAIVAAAQVINSLQTIVSRNISPFHTAVVTIGTIHGGDRYNIIPQEVNLDGTVRTMDPSDTPKMPVLIKRIAENAAAACGAKAEVDYQTGHPSVLNDSRISDICAAAAAEVLGQDNTFRKLTLNPIGEDFAYFSRQRPSAMAWLGCCPEDRELSTMPALHNAKFLPDPKAISIGIRFFCQSAVRLLEQVNKA